MEREAVGTRTIFSGTIVAERYRLGDLIGQGGMADVYAAEDLDYERQVAVKFLRPGVSASIGEERFRREISIAATLSHPHIVPLFDSGEWEGRLYYVMPRVDGRNLRELLEETGPLGLDRALRIARDVGEALAHAHARGVVHRDIKPANIILTDEYAVVSDFGVAKSWGVPTDLELTGVGMAVGTPLYMAPEQATDPDRVSPRSDTYSFGCVVYEMLTGSPPFPSSNVPGLIADHLLKDPPSLDQLDPSIPAAVARAVTRAIAKSPERRFDTISDFVVQLEQGASGGGPGRIGLPGAPGLWIGAAALAALALIASLILRPGGGSEAEWSAGRPPSVLVVAFADEGASASERTLAIDLADQLTFELSWWDSIRAVPRIVQSGAIHDLGLAGPSVTTLAEAVELARRLDAAAAAVVRVRLTPAGDSARAEYSLVRADGGRSGQGELVGASTVVEAGLDPLALIEPMVRRLLGLEDGDEPVAGRRVGTRSREAVQDFDEGMAALAGWRLQEAERRFAEAVAVDSTFAMAHLRLAQTLYWRTIDDLGATAERLGPRIFRASGAARRHARGTELPLRALDHVDAFYAFASGDYAGARERYRSLVESDPTDLFAFALRGSVEYTDPWIGEGPEGRPRSDLDVALASFRRAVELDPDFELGYGHLFAIHRLIRGADGPGGCLGFETPRPEAIAPWDGRTPQALELFCLSATRDSLAWIPEAATSDVDWAASASVAADLQEDALTRLRRWSEFKPQSPRPLEELARIRMESYEGMGPAAPEALAAAAREAADPLRRALSLRTDTVAAEVFRLANLEAAAGRIDEALTLVQLGTRLHRADDPSAELPSLAANPLLAAGRLAGARGVLRSPQQSMGIPLDGRIVMVPAPAVLGAQHALAVGALLGDPASLTPILAGILETWSTPEYSVADRNALMAFLAARMLPAMAPHAELVQAWTPSDPDGPLLDAAVAVARSDPDAVDRVRAADGVVADGSIPEAFALARLAWAAGETEIALRRLSAIDSVPLPLRQFSSTWGMRTAAHLLRTEILLAGGDTAAATAQLSVFQALVPDEGSTPDHLANRAASVRARLQPGR